jgi:hypothetical protein
VAGSFPGPIVFSKKFGDQPKSTSNPMMPPPIQPSDAAHVHPAFELVVEIVEAAEVRVAAQASISVRS